MKNGKEKRPSARDESAGISQDNRQTTRDKGRNKLERGGERRGCYKLPTQKKKCAFKTAKRTLKKKDSVDRKESISCQKKKNRVNVLSTPKIAEEETRKGLPKRGRGSGV